MRLGKWCCWYSHTLPVPGYDSGDGDLGLGRRIVSLAKVAIQTPDAGEINDTTASTVFTADVVGERPSAAIVNSSGVRRLPHPSRTLPF